MCVCCPVCLLLPDLAGEPDHMANTVMFPGDGRVCVRVFAGPLGLHDTHHVANTAVKSWCKGANYVCVSQKIQQARSGHACLTNARLRWKLHCTSPTQTNSKVSEARLAMEQAQC